MITTKTVFISCALVFAALLTGACRKNKEPLFDGVNCSGNCYLLNGKLTDSAINAGIVGGEIKFYFYDNIGTFFKQKYYIGKTHTDADGNYSFSFDGSRFNRVIGYYEAEAYKGNLFYEPVQSNRVSTFYLDSTMVNIPLTQNFKLFRPAAIKVHVVAPASLGFQYLDVAYSYGAPNHGFVLNGVRNIDTTFTLKTGGDLNTVVTAGATGNGVDIQKKQTINVPTNTTQKIEFRF